MSLGRWKSWAEPHVGLFENGERCFSGIVRSLRVTFECGEGYVIETAPRFKARLLIEMEEEKKHVFHEFS